VHHDQRADEPGADAPTGLVDVLQLVVLVQELDAESLGELLAEVVGGAGLQGALVAHHSLDGVAGQGAGELLRHALLAGDDRHRHLGLGKFLIYIQHAQGLFHSLLGRGMGGVPLLPEELRGAQEEPRAHLPAHDIGPLVDEDGQVTPGAYPLGVHGVDNGLGGRAHHQRLLQLFAAAVRDHGQLRGETLHVLGLFAQVAFRDQEGEIGIDMAGGLEAAVQRLLDVFPQGIAVRPDDHASFDRRVIGQLGLQDDVGVPARIIFTAGGDFLCHVPLLKLSPYASDGLDAMGERARRREGVTGPAPHPGPRTHRH
jgi:hypothetical protein